MTITDLDIRTQVLHSLDNNGYDFDVESIVRSVVVTYGRVDINTIDRDEYWELVGNWASVVIDGPPALLATPPITPARTVLPSPPSRAQGFWAALRAGLGL